MRSPDEIGLYIHIPFCRAKCAYCDFNSYAGLEHLFDGYTRALVQEMRTVGRMLQTPAVRFKVATIYLGGGTPTALPLTLLIDILRALRQVFLPASDIEISVEANPGAVGKGYLDSLLDEGVNRLSLGVQSFDDDFLRLLRRIHTTDEARASYRLARQAGFDNINFDLIYALPGQTLTAWQDDLREAIRLGPEHLSLYALSLGKDTLLAEWVRQGKVPQPDDDLAADMYTAAEEMLKAAGYTHYEISNWARPATSYQTQGAGCGVRWREAGEGAFTCLHNLRYWRNEPYVGFGAGAHSSYRGKRYANVAFPEEYVRRVSKGLSPVEEIEEIDEALEMAETMILGLRLVAGVRFEHFARRFGCRLEAVYEHELKELEETGLLEIDGVGVRLTAQGRLLGNEVFGRFLPPVSKRG